ncbi:protein of unknown function [Georgfuchsia toluolica]|uniref:Uncharacterized protein n=1 Tax=Georgfuchsia toluolica TaxID=424218 RepID=A0A916MZW0_9PROT|nr:protein of unknown function [Georgfuchsia toluolica]
MEVSNLIWLILIVALGIGVFAIGLSRHFENTKKGSLDGM